MITITPTAAARLAQMIAEESDAEQLGIRLVPTTTGCGSYTYSIAITEAEKQDLDQEISGIRYFYQTHEIDKLSGTVIDCDPATGRFSIFHPRPMQTHCSLTH
ncbi:iron-sulfur cluster biosynthesis family protein [Brevibacillus sp. NPDC003359]|uniref:iron-sulfur cluster biosynthesis family protein n=1 Tax=unclassified Brevibacillus TaxID=2684853 RepID=UPI0036C9853F